MDKVKLKDMKKKKNNHDYGIWSLNFHIVTKNEELYKLCYF